LAINVLSYFLYAWFARVVCILEQVNKEILGCHEAHRRLTLLCKYNADETRALVERINNYISWSLPYRSVKQLRKNKDL